MKALHVTLVVLAASLTAGCSPARFHYEVPVPRKEIRVAPASDWKPYVPDSSEKRQPDGWRPQNPDWGSARSIRHDQVVRSSPLPAPEDEHKSGMPSSAVDDIHDEFRKATPKDPPVQTRGQRRAYSSRPDRNAALNNVEDSSAFDRQPIEKLVRGSTPRQGVRSEWADKAVRQDNRPSFDRMVREASRVGSSSFEDEAGRVYFGESRRVEDGCSVVEVTVTTAGGLPVVARGLAYDCR